MSARRHLGRRRRKKLLARFPLDGQLIADIERSGLLELAFTKGRADARLLSDDDRRTVAWLAPAGAIAALLIQDYAHPESRSIPFRFGVIDVVNDGLEVAVYLTPSHRP